MGRLCPRDLVLPSRATHGRTTALRGHLRDSPPLAFRDNRLAAPVKVGAFFLRPSLLVEPAIVLHQLRQVAIGERFQMFFPAFKRRSNFFRHAARVPENAVTPPLESIQSGMMTQHAGPASSTPDVPEPTLAERARTLASLGRIGSLSTHSVKFPGFPFGSMMPYAVDDAGRPVFFISSMAMHTHNLRDDARASLLVMQPDVSGDPLGSARVTLVGTAIEAAAEDVRDLYLSRYESARQWQNYTDFAYYRLEVAGVYFIGGFGVMGWVTPQDYAGAAPDPLAGAAPGIIQHMNADHADALRRIANHAGESADEASITAVDRLGFFVRLKTGERVHGRRIAFPREVTSTDEARRVFIEMVRAIRNS